MGVGFSQHGGGQAGHKLGLAGYELVNQLPSVSKLSLSWSNHVEQGAGLNWSTSRQLFQNLA